MKIFFVSMWFAFALHLPATAQEQWEQRAEILVPRVDTLNRDGSLIAYSGTVIPSSIRRLEFSADGAYLLAEFYKGSGIKATIYDVKTGEEVFHVPDSRLANKSQDAVIFSADNKSVLSIQDGKRSIFEIKKNSSLPIKEFVVANPDAEIRYAKLSNNGQMMIWNGQVVVAEKK